MGVSGQGPSSAPCASPVILSTAPALPAPPLLGFHSVVLCKPLSESKHERGRFHARDPRQLWLFTVFPQPLHDAGRRQRRSRGGVTDCALPPRGGVSVGPHRGRLRRIAGRQCLPWVSCHLRKRSDECLQVSPAAAAAPQDTGPGTLAEVNRLGNGLVSWRLLKSSKQHCLILCSSQGREVVTSDQRWCQDLKMVYYLLGSRREWTRK